MTDTKTLLKQWLAEKGRKFLSKFYRCPVCMGMLTVEKVANYERQHVLACHKCNRLYDPIDCLPEA